MSIERPVIASGNDLLALKDKYVYRGMQSHVTNLLKQYPSDVTWDDLSSDHQIEILDCIDFSTLCQEADFTEDSILRFYHHIDFDELFYSQEVYEDIEAHTSQTPAVKRYYIDNMDDVRDMLELEDEDFNEAFKDVSEEYWNDIIMERLFYFGSPDISHPQIDIEFSYEFLMEYGYYFTNESENIQDQNKFWNNSYNKTKFKQAYFPYSLNIYEDFCDQHYPLSKIEDIYSKLTKYTQVAGPESHRLAATILFQILTYQYVPDDLFEQMFNDAMNYIDPYEKYYDIEHSYGRFLYAIKAFNFEYDRLITNPLSQQERLDDIAEAVNYSQEINFNHAYVFIREYEIAIKDFFEKAHVPDKVLAELCRYRSLRTGHFEPLDALNDRGVFEKLDDDMQEMASFFSSCRDIYRENDIQGEVDEALVNILISHDAIDEDLLQTMLMHFECSSKAIEKLYPIILQNDLCALMFKCQKDIPENIVRQAASTLKIGEVLRCSNLPNDLFAQLANQTDKQMWVWEYEYHINPQHLPLIQDEKIWKQLAFNKSWSKVLIPENVVRQIQPNLTDFLWKQLHIDNPSYEFLVEYKDKLNFENIFKDPNFVITDELLQKLEPLSKDIKRALFCANNISAEAMMHIAPSLSEQERKTMFQNNYKNLPVEWMAENYHLVTEGPNKISGLIREHFAPQFTDAILSPYIADMPDDWICIISRDADISHEFIVEHADKLDFYRLSFNPNLSEATMIQFFEKMEQEYLCEHYPDIIINNIDKVANKIKGAALCELSKKHIIPDEALIVSMKNIEPWYIRDIMKNQPVPKEVVDYFNDLKKKDMERTER